MTQSQKELLAEITNNGSIAICFLDVWERKDAAALRRMGLVRRVPNSRTRLGEIELAGTAGALEDTYQYSGLGVKTIEDIIFAELDAAAKTHADYERLMANIARRA